LKKARAAPIEFFDPNIRVPVHETVCITTDAEEAEEEGDIEV